MAYDPAREAVQGCYDALDRRDISAFSALLSDDCVMYEAGEDAGIPHGGVYRGVAEITGVFRRLSELSGGSGRFELQDLFSDGNGSVVAIHRNHGRRPDGRELDTREALLFRVEGGVVRSVRNYYAEIAEVVRFWSD
jgi:ketosteroid isomerase-like protein